ncbi:MAG TPA: hypothetical protein VFE21_03855 [Rubrobacteraceae bacterium]|nr:hypothetical protein [Rubrobacteraceae bacterium]
MSKVKVRVEGHYEVREVPYGKDYVWQPGHALIGCDCGHMMDADEHHTICPNCGADYTAVVREVVGRHLSDEVLHPWHPDYEKWIAYREKSCRESEDYASELDELE